jgi:D-alanine--poly(phosphoribitol) ligase subunit 2
MTSEIQIFIRGLLEKKSALPADFDAQTDYLRAGIIDSMGIIKFTLDIEKHFDVEINEVDIESPQFRTLAGISVMIADKLRQLANQS